MLAAAFGRDKPDKITSDTYLLAVRGFSDRQLAEAVQRIVTGDEFFPTVKRLRSALLETETAEEKDRRESDAYTASLLRRGIFPANWDGERYAERCAALGVPPRPDFIPHYAQLAEENVAGDRRVAEAEQAFKARVPVGGVQ